MIPGIYVNGPYWCFLKMLNGSIGVTYASQTLLGGVGHCFAWHVRVSFNFNFNFETEELVHSGLCVMHLGHNRIFPADRIRILPQKINRLFLHF
jgi:hypothetical protein